MAQGYCHFQSPYKNEIRSIQLDEFQICPGMKCYSGWALVRSAPTNPEGIRDLSMQRLLGPPSTNLVWHIFIGEEDFKDVYFPRLGNVLFRYFA